MTAIESFDDIGLDTPVKKSELVHMAQQPVLEVTKEVLEEELTASKEYELMSNCSSEDQNQRSEIKNLNP